jgi:hypothetical protein
VTALERGSVRARVRIDTDYTWPALRDRRSALVLRAQRRDRRGDRQHDTRAARGRALPARHARARQPGARPSAPRALPAAAPVDGSDAECAFTVVHRGLTAEGGVQETDLPTFPSRRFVDASRRSGSRSSTTAARIRSRRRRPRARAHVAAVGRLSLPLRAVAAPQPRGPDRRGPGAQMPGAQRAEYAVLFTRRLASRRLLRRGDALLVPFERAPRHAVAARTPRRRRAAGRRRGGLGRSALARRACRCACSAPSPTPGRSRSNTTARPARGLDHRPPGPPVAPFEGGVELRPWEICTLQIA